MKFAPRNLVAVVFFAAAGIRLFAQVTPPILTEAAAIERASRFTGFDGAQPGVSAKEIVIGDEVSFLSGNFEGKSGWQVVFPLVRYRVDNEPGDLTRSFTVLLDAATGHLLSARSRLAGTQGSLMEERPAKENAASLRRKKITYILPVFDPPVRLAKALHTGELNICGSVEIIAYYVTVTRDAPRASPYTAWIMLTRNPPYIGSNRTPPASGGVENPPSLYIDHNERYSKVDAITGNWLGGGSPPF